jgi:hypothetical protein
MLPLNEPGKESKTESKTLAHLSLPANTEDRIISIAECRGISVNYLKAGQETLLQISLFTPNGTPVGKISITVEPSTADDSLAPMLAIPKDGLFEPLTFLHKVLKYADMNSWSIQSDFAEGRHEMLAGFIEAYLSSLQSSEIASVIRIRSYGENIFHLELPSHFLMTAMFLRFQEHYESPNFSGKTFTLSDFKNWYRSTQEHGQFSYYTDWAGFNLPSYVLSPFYKGAFSPLSPAEEALLSRLPRSSGEKYYVIATAGEIDSGVLRHELAHGLYYTNTEYRAEVDSVLESVNLAPVERFLDEAGYAQQVFKDECHAYLGDSLDELSSFLREADLTSYEEVNGALNEIFNRFLPCSLPTHEDSRSDDSQLDLGPDGIPA